MAWNGSGTFNRTQDFTADKNAGPPASIVAAEKVDNEFNNYKAGLQNCLTRDGQNSPIGNINWSGHKITNLGAPTSGSDASNKSYVDGLFTGAAIGALVAGFPEATPVADDELLISDDSDSGNAKRISLSSLSAVVESLIDQRLFHVGDYKPTARTTEPSGWLFCAGQEISRDDYAALFAVIGTTYGAGDGSTTFNVPDWRGRSPFGKDDMGGTAANRVTNAVSGIAGNTLGAVGGDQRMHQHNHAVTDPGHSHTTSAISPFGAPAGSATFAASPQTGGNSFTTNSNTTGISIQNAGDGNSQNMPPAIICNWLIKA